LAFNMKFSGKPWKPKPLTSRGVDCSLKRFKLGSAAVIREVTHAVGVGTNGFVITVVLVVCPFLS